MGGVKRNPRADIDDRWTKRVKGDDGKMRNERSAVYGKVTRWRVRWVDETGREHSKSFARKPDAQTFLNRLTADLVRGDYVDPLKSGETFGSVAEDWFLTKSHRKPKTLAGYRGLLDTLILPRWGGVQLKALDHQSLTRWIGELSVDGSQRGTPLSASRIRQTHQCMNAVLGYAMKSGKVAKNVAAGIERKHDLPTEHGRRQYALTHEQLLGLASRIDRFGTLTLVLGYTGIRFGEAAALRRENVRDRKLTVTESATRVTGQGVVTTRTKTGKTREVAVPGPVWDRLCEHLLAAEREARHRHQEISARALLPEPYRQTNELVFSNRRGTTLTNHQYRYEFDKAVATMRAEADEARSRELAETGQALTPEFPPITPHDLRHTCASLLIATGANIKVVQRQLGHATAAMTLDRYGHLYDADLTRAADDLGKAMSATAVPLRYANPDQQAGTGWYPAPTTGGR